MKNSILYIIMNKRLFAWKIQNLFHGVVQSLKHKITRGNKEKGMNCFHGFNTNLQQIFQIFVLFITLQKHVIGPTH